jgi:hypothetical protein
MTIRWTQPTLSGLCDRLIDIIAVIALARVQGATLYVDWPVFDFRPSLDVAHRQTDILIENVQQYINFPAGIVFDAITEADRSFPLYIGTAIPLDRIHQDYLSDVCSLDVYLETAERVAKEFSFCPVIESFIKTVPDKFVSFHIRRGDKVRTEQHDGSYIHVSELEYLDRITYQAIDYHFRLGYDTFFFCGDEDHKKKPFVDYAVAKGAKTFTIPSMDKWQSTYFDIAVMTKSELNITSQRYSSFPRFPALIGKGKFNTVFNLEKDGVLT